MELSEILDRRCVIVPLKAANKQEAIEMLVEALCQAGRLSDAETALSAVMERERIRSTGIGQGLAVPHGKCNVSDNLMLAAGLLEQEIDFDSIDKKPVRLVALLISPTNRTGEHIQALARICNVVQNDTLRDRLAQVKSDQDLYDLMVVKDTAAA